MDKYRYRHHVGETGFEARFATEKEIKRSLSPVDFSKKLEKENAGGIPFLSDTKKVYVDGADAHTLILGSTGSMKSRCLILPGIYTLGYAGENMVIADPKGELFDKTSGYLKSQNYKIHVLNLRDMENSDCWNPLQEAYKLFHDGESEAAVNEMNDFISTLYAEMKATSKDVFWPTSAMQLATGLAEIMLRLAKSSDECNPASLSGMVSYVLPCGRGEYDMPPFNEKILKNIKEGTSLSINLTPTLTMSAQVTLDGIKSNTTAGFEPFTKSALLMALSSRSTFDIHDFAKPNEKHVVYLITPDENTTYHFFAAAFVKQLYGAMIRDSANLPGQTLPKRLNFVLDEFANMPRIENMPSMITAARSRNMRFYLVVQSNNQLKSQYDRDAETIKTNCLNWVYLASKEDELIKQVMDIAGENNGRPLISYQELSSMRKVDERIHPNHGGADALLLLNREKPFMSFLPDVSRYKQFASIPPVELPKLKKEYKVFSIKTRVLSSNVTNEELKEALTRNYPKKEKIAKVAPNPQMDNSKNTDIDQEFNDLLKKLKGNK